MGAKSLTSLGRVWKISMSSVSGFPQGLLVGEPSTDALQEGMLTALPTLGKPDFIYTAMEKGLNMWNSMDQSGGPSAQSRQEHKHPEEKNVLVPGRVNISAELFCTSMSHRGGFRRPSIQARSNFICQLKWFSGTQTFRRRKMLAMTPESATPRCEQGQKELRYSSCVCCPKSCPRKRCQDRFRNLPICTHGFSLCVCVCLCACRPLWMTLGSSTTWELLS